MKKITLLFLFMMLSSLVSSQNSNSNSLSKLIRQKQSAGVPFDNKNVFTKQTHFEKLKRKVGDVTLLTLDRTAVKEILDQKPQALELHIPFKDTEITVELVAYNPLSTDFHVLDAKTNALYTYQTGAHYRGIVNNDEHSLVAMSFTTEEVMGVISSSSYSNINIGQLSETNDHNDYVAYSVDDIDFRPQLNCLVKDSDFKDVPVVNTPVNSLTGVAGCVRLSLELDNDMYVYKNNSVQQTVDYITALFNVVTAVFQLEDVSMKVSQVFVWTTPDTYPTNDGYAKLTQFITFRTNFTGDIAQLVTLDPPTNAAAGGLAQIDVLCKPAGIKYNWTDILEDYAQLPTGSWTVNTLAHELGHNLGSPHTHSCTWAGGAIDGCAAVEGTCSLGPPIALNGGTVMSYCPIPALHNGFGPLPGALIRSRVQNAACLSATCTNSTCATPTNITLSSLPNGNSAVFTWTAGSGNTAFNLLYRTTGTNSNWTTLTGVSSPYTLNVLTPNTNYEALIIASCSGVQSDNSASIIFKTLTGTCVPPTNLTVSVTNTNAVLNWTENAAATSWEIRYGANGFDPSVSGTTIVVNTTRPYTLSNLTLNTSYDWYVRSVCAGGTNGFTPYSVVGTFVTPSNIVYCTANYNSPCLIGDAGSCGLIPVTIKKFQLNKASDNSTIINNDNNGCLGATSDHTNIVGTVVAGQAYNFSIGLGTSSPQGCYYYAYIGIWVDYNSDGDFLDANETLFLSPDANTFTGSFTIPANIANGNKRLRVRRWGGTAGVNPACATFGDGEAEDYTLNVTNGIVIPPSTSTGKCLSVSDGTQYAQSIGTSGSFSSSFTIETWVNFTNPTTGNSGFLCELGKASGSVGPWMWFNNANTFGAGYNYLHLGFGGGNDIRYSFTPTANTWYHLAYVFNVATNQTTLYVNGVSRGAVTQNGVNPLGSYGTGNYDIFLGRRIYAYSDGTNLNLNGKLDEFRFWNVARTATEIANNYQIELAGTESNLVSYYKFDDTAGSCGTLLEDCKNGNTAKTFNSASLVTSDAPLTTDIACGNTAASTTCTFTGLCNSNWNDAANWSCGHVPTATDSTIINNKTVVIDATATCRGLRLEGTSAFLNPSVSTPNMLTVTNLDWRGGAIKSPITIAANGALTKTGSSFTLASKIINHGTINNFNATNITLMSGAAIENQTDGIMTDPNFDAVTAVLIALDNYGKIILNQNTTIQGALLKNYGDIEFKANVYLSLNVSNPNQTSVFGSGATVTATGVLPSIILYMPLEIQGNLNLSGVSFTMNAGASLTGAGSLTTNRTFSWNRGAISCPLTIAYGGLLSTQLNNLQSASLASKITNHGTIINLYTSNITFLTGAILENQTDGEMTNPDFSSSTNGLLKWDNYGKITYSTATAFNVRCAALNNYGTIDFQANNALFLYQNTVFGTGATFSTGFSPFLYLSAPLEFQADFNAKNVSITLNSSTAALSGIGKLTIEKSLSWGYGAISCPIDIKLGATASLFYNGSNLALNNIFNNNGTTTLYQPKVDFNNGTFNNNNKLVVSNGVSQFLNTTGTNTLNSCGMISSSVNTEFQIKVGFPSCVTSIVSGNITVNSDGTVTISGTLSPGTSPGTITINPSVIATSTAIFDMEITGGYGAAGTADDADKLLSIGNIEINGTLLLRLTNIQTGNYTIIDGASVSGLPGLSGNFTSIQYSINGGAFTTTQPAGLTISYAEMEGTVTISYSSVLPVELVTFKGQNTEGGNLLTWQTAMEINTLGFDIERSNDGKNFEKIGDTKAQGKATTYDYLDDKTSARFETSPTLVIYYRLKINDLDGSSAYSNIVSISQKGKPHVKIYPNPTRHDLTIDLGDATQATIRLIDVLGREIMQKKGQSGQVLLDISSLSVGIYFAEVTAKGVSVREKVVKN